MSNQLPEQGKPWPLYIAIAAAVLLIGLALFFAGGSSASRTDDPDAEIIGTIIDEGDCDRKLSEILTAMDPLRLGVSTNPQDCAHDLNQWRTECGRPPDGKPIAEDAAVVASLLPPEVVKRVNGQEFTQRDVAHIRTSLMLRQLADHVALGSDDPMSQAVRLFDFVQRNVLDPMPGMTIPPLTLYEVLCYGRGTPEQRAWLFAELLRQIRLDAVLIEPSPPQTVAPDATPVVAHGPLIGVLIKSGDQTEVYVFDAAIGLPLPGPAEAASKEPFVRQPATLAQLRADDDLLRQLDVAGQPYPLTSQQLQSVRAGIVGSSSLWAERIALVAARTEFREAVFYDGLGPNRLRKPPLLERIVAGGAAGLWTKEQVFVWPVPEDQLTRFASAGVDQDPLLAMLDQVLRGPYMEVQPSGTGTNLEWDQTLRDARNLQICGDFSGANAMYRAIRQASIIRTYLHTQQANDSVQDFATYWTALCQYEVGEHKSVRNTVGQYPPHFYNPQVPPYWLDGVPRIAALSSAELGLWADAFSALQAPTIRPTHGTLYLLKRWQRIGQANQPVAPPMDPASASPQPPAPASQVETPAPASTQPAAPPAPMPDAKPSPPPPAETP